MRKIFVVLAAATLLGGCATKEGIKLPTGSGPTKESVEDFNKRNSTAQAPSPAEALPRDTVKTALVPEDSGPRMIIIGNVMALTVFDEKTLNSRYDTYLRQVSARASNPTFSRDWYVSTGSGETAVKFSGVTGLYSRFYKAEVPKDLMRQITFASAFGTFMAGTSGDLVAAERSPKTGTWITRLLCSEKAPDYATCEGRYQRGIYQAVDGREIDDKLQLVGSGKRIDPATYVAVTETERAEADHAAEGKSPPRATPTSTELVPPPVPVSTQAPAAPSIGAAAVPAPAHNVAAPKDIAQQLGKLNELKAKGLVSEAEYQAKRKQLLDSL